MEREFMNGEMAEEARVKKNDKINPAQLVCKWTFILNQLILY